MENNNNIKKFTSIDIEKYHRGQLSSGEMHELEKAALDDPFLADAIEGYAVAGVGAKKDLAELKARLSKRLGEATVLPMHNRSNVSVRLLRVAAVIVLIVGAGLLVYQLGFNNRSKQIAQSQPEPKKENSTADSGIVIAPATVGDTNAIGSATTREQKDIAVAGSDKGKKNTSEKIETEANGAGLNKVDYLTLRDSVVLRGDVVTSGNNKNPVTMAPAKTTDEKNKSGIITRDKDGINDVAKEGAGVKSEALKQAIEMNEAQDRSVKSQGEDQFKKNRALDNSRAENRAQTNLFRGLVTDPNNNPVPFANVTNTVDNVGTYSDARGNFNLVSSDSVLNVQIRSIGYVNNNVQLRNNVAANQVVMEEDKSLNARVLDPVKRNANRAFDNNVNVEEPEPADGWANYDTYLINNLKVPDELKTKQSSGTVELSFEVNKDGDPVNIKVVRSLCAKCDKEAIRLIKEGPKWKRKTRKGRTSVTIPF